MSGISFIDVLKFGYRYVDFKIQQRWLQTNETIEAKTNDGPIRGVKRMTIYDNWYYSFEGIPFAKPPINELRFRAPQPPEPWTDVRDCTNMCPRPLQVNYLISKTKGSEDCLYLNVYTKNLKPEKPTPVMVWIYGGGFQVGEATRDLSSPDYFIEENVILITITYRLNAFGFISFDDPELGVPGNAGLKDQVLALKWVKENCAHFGGDPNNITVFGESAGGASTHYMMITDQTKDLFHRGILMSGTTLAPWALTVNNNYPYKLAKVAGYNGLENDSSVLKFLMGLKGPEIIKAGANLLSKEEKRDRILFAFGPRIEPYVMDDCVIPKHPRLMMKNAWSNNIPLLLGGTSFEGLLFYPETKRRPKTLTEVNDCEYYTPLELNLDRASEKCIALGKTIKQAHFGDEEPGPDTLLEFLDMLSLREFWHPINRTILSRLENSKAPTYLYRFDFDSKDFNHMRNLFCGKSVRGTCHGDDLSYIFYNFFSWKLNKDSLEYQTIKRMVGMMASFSSTGNPTISALNDVAFDPVKIDPTKMGSNAWKCLNISDEIQILDLPETHKLTVWDNLYPKDELC